MLYILTFSYIPIVFAIPFPSSPLIFAKKEKREKVKKEQHIIMHCFRVFMLLLLQCVLIVHAQKGTTPEETQPKEPVPLPPQYHAPADETPQGPGLPKANAPGALAVGKNRYITPADEETDTAEILEKLKELVEKIVDLVDNGGSTSTLSNDNGSPIVTIVPTATIKNRFPTSASPCAEAANYYDLCSSSFANFTTLPATQQAGCLCNVYSDADFNSNMQGCYSYVRTQTQYQSYTSAIANGTSLCAATYMALPAATTTPTPTATTSTHIALATNTPSTGARSQGYACGAYYILLASVVGFAFLMA